MILKPLYIIKSCPNFDKDAKLCKAYQDTGALLIWQVPLNEWVAEGVASEVFDFFGWFWQKLSVHCVFHFPNGP